MVKPQAQRPGSGGKKKRVREADDDALDELRGGGGGGGGGAFALLEDDGPAAGGGRKAGGDPLGGSRARGRGSDYGIVGDDEEDQQAEEQEETAEEKRLRLGEFFRFVSAWFGFGGAACLSCPLLSRRRRPLAKTKTKKQKTARDYLAQIRAIERADAAEGDTDDDDDGGRGGDPAARLRDAAADAAGRLHRRLAGRLRVPPPPADADAGAGADAAGPQQRQGAAARFGSTGRLARAHRLSATAVALTSDDRTAFTVSKDGTIYRWDVETLTRVQLLRPGAGRARAKAAPGARSAPGADRSGAPEWVRPAARLSGGDAALFAAAVSSDGRFLAVGGGSKDVHVFDVGSGAAPSAAGGGSAGNGGGGGASLLAPPSARAPAAAGSHLFTFPGHKDAVTGLCFREGSHDLYSCALDRTVKLWSAAEGAYVDTLFGHQAPCSSVSASRAERCVTAGADRTCRVWKIPEESQLVFRAPGAGSACVEAVAHVSGTEWVSGGADGTVALWSQTKKRPVHVVRGAHGPAAPGPETAVAVPGGGAAGEARYGDPAYARALDAAAGRGGGRGGGGGGGRSGGGGGGWADVGSEARRWVQSVAAARGSDLAASGAGDGLIKLWRVVGAGAGAASGGAAGATALEPAGALPAPGFANGLALARSGRFLLAAMGTEPRLGRWARWPAGSGATNGLLRHTLELADD